MTERRTTESSAKSLGPLLRRLTDTWRLTTDALRKETKNVALVRALADLDRQVAGRKHLSRAERRRIAESKKNAALATTEVNEDFPTVNGQLLVVVWGYLEAFIEDFLADWVERRAEAVTSEEAQGIRVRLADFIAMDDRERALFLVSEVARRAPGHGGIGQFEFVVSVFGLDGNLEPETRRALIEMGAIRNVLLHRAGVVDRQFVTVCPWLRYERGQMVRVSSDDALRYVTAVARYATELAKRRQAASGTQVKQADPTGPKPLIDAGSADQAPREQ